VDCCFIAATSQLPTIPALIFLTKAGSSDDMGYFPGTIHKQQYKLKDREGMSVPGPGLFLALAFSFLFCRKS